MTVAKDGTERLRLPPPRQSWGNTVWSLLGFAALGAILVACAVYTAPMVLSDWRIRDTARPAENGWVTDGKCTTKIVLHICDMTLNLRTSTGSVARRVNYVFTGAHAGDYRIAVMADPAHPDRVTADLGLDRLWNRTITLLAIAGAIGFIIVAGIVAMFRNRRAASRAAQ
jgi:hypothetical protein